MQIQRGELHDGQPISIPCWVPNENPAYKEALALFWCPKGHISRISPNIHNISANGEVSPSYVCPHEGCFHEWVRLEEWKS